MANDIMIDMETLDTSPYCVILTIGAVRFDPKGSGIVERLELRPTIDEQTEKYNRVINEDTIRWWGEQSEAAREEAMGDAGRISYRECMEALYKFCWNRRAVWSNGASFDVVVAETAWRQLEMRIPWPFYTVRDTRTLYEVAGVKLSDGGHSTSHKAVEDAERQAIVVQKAYRKLISAGVMQP
jgi:3' exoribonuclease, RNase T-like